MSVASVTRNTPTSNVPVPKDTLHLKLCAILEHLSYVEDLAQKVSDKLIGDGAATDQVRADLSPSAPGINGLVLEIDNRAQRISAALEGISEFLA